MKFSETNTVEAHLRDPLVGAASARSAELLIGFANGGIHSAPWSRL